MYLSLIKCKPLYIKNFSPYSKLHFRLDIEKLAERLNKVKRVDSQVELASTLGFILMNMWLCRLITWASVADLIGYLRGLSEPRM